MVLSRKCQGAVGQTGEVWVRTQSSQRLLPLMALLNWFPIFLMCRRQLIPTVRLGMLPKLFPFVAHIANDSIWTERQGHQPSQALPNNLEGWGNLYLHTPIYYIWVTSVRKFWTRAAWRIQNLRKHEYTIHVIYIYMENNLENIKYCHVFAMWLIFLHLVCIFKFPKITCYRIFIF